MKMDQKREMIEQASCAAESVFKRTGRVLPMYDMLIDGKRMIAPMPQVESKDLAVAMMKTFFATADVTAYVFIDEAWFLSKPAAEVSEEEKSRAEREGLANHPERQEILWFIAEDETGMLQATRAIIRPDHGEARLGPLEFLEADQFEGRLCGLLPPKGAAN